MATLDEILQLRELVTELPESVILSSENVLACVPAAIALWQDRVANNPAKRYEWIKESAPINITANVADISGVIAAMNFRQSWLHESDIIIEDYLEGKGPSLTVKFVPTYDRLVMSGRQDLVFIKAYLTKRNTIEFRHPTTNPWTASNIFKIRSVVLPSNLTDIPNASLPEFATTLAEVLKAQYRQQNRGLDLQTRQ